MMNRSELNEEMMTQVNGGRRYKMGEHVEVKSCFGTTCGGTIKIIFYDSDKDEFIYYVDIEKWGDTKSDAWYRESDFE